MVPLGNLDFGERSRSGMSRGEDHIVQSLDFTGEDIRTVLPSAVCGRSIQREVPRLIEALPGAASPNCNVDTRRSCAAPAASRARGHWRRSAGPASPARALVTAFRTASMTRSCSAGGLTDIRPLGRWWAATPQKDWPAESEAVARIHANWRAPFGDRRQELVFIGTGIDRAAQLSR